MTSRRAIFACAAAVSATGASALTTQEKKKEFILGKDYIAVEPPVEFASRPILVHDFFAYTCPHCLRLAPLMADYAKSIETDPDVRLIPVPVAWDESFELFPKIYFAFEALDRLSTLHMPFWEWMLREDHPWSNVEEARVDIEKWIKGQGISASKWNDTLESFIVRNKVRQAGEIWRSYNIDSTPVVGIAGRFITAPHMTGSRPATIEAIRMLVDKVKIGLS